MRVILGLDVNAGYGWNLCDAGDRESRSEQRNGEGPEGTEIIRRESCRL